MSPTLHLVAERSIYTRPLEEEIVCFCFRLIFDSVMRAPALWFSFPPLSGPLIPVTNGGSFYETIFQFLQPTLDHEYDRTLQGQF